ncbi:MAG TPA: putative quinol monooxygenase [Lacisediminihabitans sp.]|uniref:putative quinol monooxygenase n=1 Tax=Lacisediminihabitans sp. TaxID=2787631 RepID=UPI002EDB01F7
MYHIAVSWDVQPERVKEFIAAALKDGREAGAAEPGTLRFELIADPNDKNRFYLNEAYADEAAFDAHAAGDFFKEFFAEVGPYSEISWLFKGTTVTE